jgi:hypothetical protein
MNAETPDATTFVESLDERQLAERLRTLDREQAAIRVLLRAARARHRQPVRGSNASAPASEKR